MIRSKRSPAQAGDLSIKISFGCPPHGNFPPSPTLYMLPSGRRGSNLRRLRRRTGVSSAALRAATASLLPGSPGLPRPDGGLLRLFTATSSGREQSIFHDRSMRSWKIYSPAAKVGKNALEPTVQDSLDGQARTRLCPIRGIKGCAALIGIGEASEFLILRVSNLVAWKLTDSACRPVKGVESARGTF